MLVLMSSDKLWENVIEQKGNDLSIVIWGKLRKTHSFTFRDKRYFSSRVGGGRLSHEGLMTFFREKRENPSSKCSFFTFFQLKIFSLPKYHILGYCVLSPISNDMFPLFQRSFNNENIPEIVTSNVI